MSKATDKDLGELHGALARALTDVVAAGVSTVVDGEVVKMPASPAYLAAAITFLKNNNITAGKDDSELDALKQALEQKRRRGPALSQQALDEAAALFDQRLQ